MMLFATFAPNPKGFVTPENHRDYVLVNGHSKMYEKSENNNFAVLVSKTFTRPFKDPQLYSPDHSQNCEHACRRWTACAKDWAICAPVDVPNPLTNNLVKPTLEAECGDVSSRIPAQNS